jgi:branched-subunit amino acid transport protein
MSLRRYRQLPAFAVESQHSESTEGRSISWPAWAMLILFTILTFIIYLIYDPHPSFLLATSAAGNMAIMLWALYRLYQMDLLLSPMSTAVIGPTMIVYYTWGNLGARIAGEGRFGSNFGTLYYYPVASLLTTFGLLIFCWTVFFLFKDQLVKARFKYGNLNWSPVQALLAAVLAGGIVSYLSYKYPFINGYFFNVTATFDRWLAASYLYFLILAAIIGASVMVKSKNFSGRLLGFLAISVLIGFALSTRSRTYLISFIAIVGMAWVSLEPYRIKRILLTGLMASILLFPLGTVIKVVGMRSGTDSMLENLNLLSNMDLATILDLNSASGSLDLQYRMAGLEHPAAIVMAYFHNASPLYGEGFLGGLISALPGFLRPDGFLTERQIILYQYSKYGMFYGDSIGLPISSGLTDFGIYFAPLIYFFMGAFCIILWLVGQNSPRLFLACMVVWTRVDPMDLFWEDGLFTLRAMAFVWLALLAFGFLLMPTIAEERATSALPSRTGWRRKWVSDPYKGRDASAS